MHLPCPLNGFPIKYLLQQALGMLISFEIELIKHPKDLLIKPWIVKFISTLFNEFDNVIYACPHEQANHMNKFELRIGPNQSQANVEVSREETRLLHTEQQNIHFFFRVFTAKMLDTNTTPECISLF